MHPLSRAPVGGRHDARNESMATTRARLKPPRSTRVAPRTRALRRQLHGPSSVHTTPHGQPTPPGAHSGVLTQFAQLPLEQVQLWPPLDTRVPCRYPGQLPEAYAARHVGALPPHTFAVPPPPHV